MFVQLLSDAHCEMHADYGHCFVESIQPYAPVLVIAGDFITSRFGEDAIPLFQNLCAKWKHVVYVPGNHEYYGGDPEELHSLLRFIEENAAGLHILRPGKVHNIEGKRFLGGTGWFKDDYLNNHYADGLADFDQIRKFVPWVYEQHKAFRKFLERELLPGDIVVTHHAPTYRSIPDRFKSSALNRFYVSEFDDLLVQREPALWMHGHMHDACDYTLCGSRVVCNPHGYPTESSAIVFNDKLILEVP